MALNVGAQAPDFTAKDTSGNTISLATLAGQKFVLYFYPKDDTPGCTKEACSFRDNWATYQAQGIGVYGVSMDDASSHQAFTNKYSLPFPLIADTDGKLAKAYDADGGGYAKRITYVIDETGKIAQVFTSVNTASHASDILVGMGV